MTAVPVVRCDVDAAAVAVRQVRRALGDAVAGLALLVLRARIAARAAVVVVRAGRGARLPAQRLPGVRVAVAPAFDALRVVAARLAARAAVGVVRLRVDAPHVALGLARGARRDAIALGAKVTGGARVATRAAVLRVRLEVAARVAAVGLPRAAPAAAHEAGCAATTLDAATAAVVGVGEGVHARHAAEGETGVGTRLGADPVDAGGPRRASPARVVVRRLLRGAPGHGEEHGGRDRDDRQHDGRPNEAACVVRHDERPYPASRVPLELVRSPRPGP